MPLTPDEAKEVVRLVNVAIVSRGQIHVAKANQGDVADACRWHDEDRAAFTRYIEQLTEK